MMAVLADPGIPSVRSGMNAPAVAELLADSGAATPSTAPFPNRSGRLEKRLATAYEMNDATVDPAPGNAPMKNPGTDPCATAPVESLRSCLVGNSSLSRRGTLNNL